MRVVVVGAGGHGQVVADILLQRAAAFGEVRPIGFVDDDISLLGQEILGLPILGHTEVLESVQHDGIVIAIGSNARRYQLSVSLAARGERLMTAIHPSAQIGNGVELAPGVMVSAGVVINTGSRVGMSAIVNTGATVDHHTHVGDCAHIAPGVHMGGQVHVGDRTLVGIGAIVLPRTHIGNDATIGAGAVVTTDVPGAVTVVGVPARVLVRV